jgi:type II secretory pathway pseudopilin PulG
VETLVVLSVVGLLVGLILPAAQHVREAANRTACANNLHQIGIACLAYEADHRTLPPSFNIEAGASWMVVIMPYMEQDPLYKQWDMTKTYYEQTDAARLGQLPNYFCPSRRSPHDVTKGSVAGDYPWQLLFEDVRNPSIYHKPGALADYAGNMGLTNC